MAAAAENQVAGLSILVQLSRRVREAGTEVEIGFIALNESKQLLHYRQSALWLRGSGVAGVSGVPEPDTSSPYVQWLAECFRLWDATGKNGSSGPDDFSGALGDAWHEWAPEHAVVAPLNSQDGNRFGLLAFFREEPWNAQDMALLGELTSIYAHGLTARQDRGGWWKSLRKCGTSARIKSFLIVCAAASLLLPVRMSVLAPAEVVPKDPFVVRSPLDTVIDRFHVKPNQEVSEGQLLFEFDRTNLGARHGVASKAYQVAAEEYRQAAQTALVDDKYRAEITPRKGKMEEKATELSYSNQLLRRVDVRAPRSGIAVFAEQGDWVGKSVAVGERILTIADPSHVEMLIRLPVADAIELNSGNRVRLYLSIDPQHPLDGTVRYVAYKPETIPSGIVVYRLKADFAPGVKLPRIGLAGTARIYGKKVSIGYFIFRRPFTALRQNLGW